MRDASLPDPAVRRAIRGGAAAVLPVGATEQHGAHLPVSTDSDIVTEVARRLASGRGYLLLPTICYGVSREHAPLLNVGLGPRALRAAVSGVCASLASNGVGTVFVLNGHHGNQGALRAPFRGRGMPRVRVMHYWRHMRRPFDHAGHAETSLMLAISGGVDMRRARRGLVTDGLPGAEARRLARLARRSFPEAAPGGVWGDPTGATAADGEAMLSEIVRGLGRECRACLAGGGP